MAYESNQVTPGSTSASSMPPPYPKGTSSDEIRRDIDNTRAEMDETVDCLQERLKPRHLLDDVLDAFRSSSGSSGTSSDSYKQIGSRIVDKFKENPVPAALIGAGVAWLLFEGNGSKRTRSGYTPRKWDVPEYSGSYVDARTGQPYAANYGQDRSSGRTDGPGVMGQAKEMFREAAGKMSSAAGAAKAKAEGAIESAKEGASSLADKASEWTGAARESAESAGEAIGEYASAASDQAYRGYRAGKHYVERGIEDYPLAMGAAALALGMLTGLLLPHTDAEDRLMGERADDLKESAKAAGKEVLESGKHVAAATASAAQEEAGRQGASPNSLVDKVKHVAQDVKHAVTESAKREGLDPDTLAQKGKQVAERAKDAAKDEVQRQKDHIKSSNA